ncbi:putative amino acid ABC transporter, ATP-binding protein [Streptococcus oralis]|uniref:Putative amino acid ABC transporter, ATP-binding protein n=1 Tax=Streptococcus oralis TaxID=1303 RepID=A0A139RP87_STROR|nr:putative amino acid ABC transporter, ATP-binding protein [Streptococcus oralis]
MTKQFLARILSDATYSVKYMFSYSIKIKEQTRKLAAGCSKHCFEVADRADVV